MALDISRGRRVRWEPHEPQHRNSLTRNLRLAHHRFIGPPAGNLSLPLLDSMTRSLDDLAMVNLLLS